MCLVDSKESAGLFMFKILMKGKKMKIEKKTLNETLKVLGKVVSHNGVFREFQSKFMKNLSRKGLKPQYVAVREQSKEKHQHYHVALILDGQKTQSIHNHIHTAERLWDLTLGLPARENGYGLIDDCTTNRNGDKQENGVILRYDDPFRYDKKEDCFRRASYLAKTNTKGNTPKGQRELFSSRIPKENT